MADGFTISAEGLDDAAKRMAERAERMKDLSIPLKVVAAEIEKRTDDAFRGQMSPAGERWTELAESTRLARKGARKLERRLNRRTERGGLTKGAEKARAKYGASRGVAITSGGEALVFARALVDTGRMRNSVRVRVRKHEIEFSAVGYMGPHITGGQRGGKPNRPPKRNPTVFQQSGFSRANARGWESIPEVQSYLLRVIGKFISTGQVT